MKTRHMGLILICLIALPMSVPHKTKAEDNCPLVVVIKAANLTRGSRYTDSLRAKPGDRLNFWIHCEPKEPGKSFTIRISQNHPIVLRTVFESFRLNGIQGIPEKDPGYGQYVIKSVQVSKNNPLDITYQAILDRGAYRGGFVGCGVFVQIINSNDWSLQCNEFEIGIDVQ